MRNDFDVNALTDVTVVVPDMTGLTPAELGDYAAELSRIPDVTAVSSPGGAYADGVHVGPPTGATGLNDGSAFLTVNSTAPLYSQASETQLDRLHAVTPPAGRETMFAGAAQINRDTAQAVSSRLPFVLALIGIVTFVLMFLLTGSVVLPLKTLVLNMLSLSAAFGALVWIFQDGHLGGARHHDHRNVGRQRAGAVVLPGVRAVDGLRGVPDLAHPRVLGGVGKD